MPFTWEIKTGPALSDWDASLARILARGGEAFRSEIAHYPPPRGGPWSHRTGNLAATVQRRVRRLRAGVRLSRRIARLLVSLVGKNRLERALNLVAEAQGNSLKRAAS